MSEENLSDLVHALQVEVRKLRDERMPALENAVRAQATSNTKLVSPGGQYALRIEANDYGAGVFVTGANGQQAALFAGYGTDLAQVAAWHKSDPNRPVDNSTVALVAAQGGHLKITDSAGVVNEFHARDLVN